MIKPKRPIPTGVIVMAMMGGALHAQTNTDGSDAEPTVQTDRDRITVTGSRIKRQDMEGASPLTIIDRQSIEMTGAQNVTDILKDIPAVVGNSVTTTTTNGGLGGAGNVTLRGLPSTATLVLVNGRRLPNDGVGGETPDLNAIPVGAIERIEILKDGASAIYGSDAIAGVVNIILRQDFEGIETELFYGISGRGDMETRSVGVTYGGRHERGNLMIGVNFYDQDRVRSADRDVSKQALTPSSSTDRGYYDATAGGVILRPDFQGANPTEADFRPYDGSVDAFNFADYTDAIMAQQRKSLFLSGTYDFTPFTRAYIESSYTNTVSEYNAAPTPIFTGFETGSLVVSADNPYNPTGQDLSDVRRRLVELGPRSPIFDSHVSRLVLGFEGDFSNTDWTWDLHYNHGNTKTLETSRNIINKTRFQAAIGPTDVCDALSDCVPLNLFGPEGSITQEQLNWVRTEANLRGESSIESLTFSMSGETIDLPAGPLALAFGVTYREEDISFNPDGQKSSYSTIGDTNVVGTEGSRKATEVFVESLVPIIESLDLELAARFSDYSDFGSQVSPKVSLRYQPMTDFLLRGTFSQGYRAPTLRELYQGPAEAFAFFNDPCSVPGTCAQDSDPSIFQFLTLQGGNPDLKAEESESFTFGFAYSPNFGLNLKADYFQVETKNAIDINGQFVIDQFRASEGAVFGENVVVDENNNIRQVNAIALNLAARKVKGADFAVDYTINFAPHRLTLGLSGTHFIEYLNQADASSEFENVVGKFVDAASNGRGSIPKWKANFNVVHATGPMLTALTTNFTSELDTGSAVDEYKTMDAWLTHDLQFSYHLEDIRSRISLGINNLLDEKPPVSDTAFNDNIDARTHNLIGRYFYARLNTYL